MATSQAGPRAVPAQSIEQRSARRKRLALRGQPAGAPAPAYSFTCYWTAGR
ncbi:hypothetical protein L544_4360 [Bordetella hinzii OH87 BAL007II]|uniref:Uncharacterized protein n=1 Tax=Bordetella hinzii OH87 BAL007II TaxID=1331262 RepID=A0ABR4R150_9BORD|nr:hypothetical protein L544_4360 [Bordetella hinzii OH87 BAL007II]